ncbi:MAG: taurine ABC transporter substrate-binding protein [Pseudomonadota bacterium]
MGRRLHWTLGALATLLVLLAGAQSFAQAKRVTIGYQQIYNPWKVAIVDQAIEKATGYDIEWRAFDSGAKVINAMASGDVQIALAGSSPIAAGVSRGLQIELFWIVEDIAAAEALVVREGSGIIAPQDLKGKKLGVPFVSTTHFHLLFALEQFGIDARDVKILNMQPDAIARAWSRGDIDAAFVWEPTLGAIKQSGKVLITSGLLSSWGKATFDGLVSVKDWAAANPEFMVALVKEIAKADAAYRDDPQAWTATSEMVQKIVGLVGGDPEAVPAVLALYTFPTLEEQASERWLGGGAARALLFTSEFLIAEGKLDTLLPDYGTAVNPTWVQRALEQP